MSRVHRNATCVLAALAPILVLPLGGEPGNGVDDAPGWPRPVVQAAADHHVHIRSPEGVEVLNRLEEIFGRPSGEPAQPRSPLSADDAVAALDAAGVRRGLVLSTAYMFGAPDIEIEDEWARVRAENDYVAGEVARYPDRLVGACSVNPLADYAFDEVERCGDDPRLGAFKLHLANSGVDLGDAGHIDRLADLFQKFGRLGRPVVVHLRSRDEDYGAEDATLFIERVLSQAPRLPVQIAHMAGWGGYDDATDAALGAFVSAIGEGRLAGDLYTFDLGAVVFQPAAAGADTALERRVREANELLAERIRQIGADRVVYATDWPSWPPVPDPRTGIERNIRLIEAELPLTADEMTRVLGNVGPALRDRR